jgi:hypothetical protein
MPDTKISAFPAATSLATGDVIPVVQASADKKADFTLFGYLPVSASIFVDVAGSDTTGLRGRRDKPFLTIAAAIAVAVAGDLIIIGPGTFTPSAVLVPPAGASLFGSGLDVTVIDTGLHDGIVLATGSIVSDLTVGKDNGGNGSARFPIRCTASDTAFTSAIVQRCKLIGNTDGFYFNVAGTTGFRAYDCIIQTTFDTTFLAAAGGVFEFFNCDFISDGTIGGALNCRAINAANGAIVRAYNCKATITNPAGSTAAIYGTASGTIVEIYGMRTQLVAKTVYDAQQDTNAIIRIDGVSRYDGSPLITSGLITYLNWYPGNKNLVTSGLLVPEAVFDDNGDYVTVG